MTVLRVISSLTVAVLAVSVSTSGPSAKVKVRSDYDKTYDFASVRTWTWDPQNAGEVKMMLTPDDDPEAVRQRFEPTIRQAVEQELSRRGLTQTTPEQADLRVMYYVLISLGSSAQEVGQFLPAVAAWGLPPLPAATTSLRMIEQGSLVIDMIAPRLKSVVWRGIAQAEIHRERTDPERQERIREALRDMLGKYPPKK